MGCAAAASYGQTVYLRSGPGAAMDCTTVIAGERPVEALRMDVFPLLA